MSTEITTDTIDSEFQKWSGGFWEWARAAEEETIEDLQKEDFDGLAYEIAYCVREGQKSRNEQPSRFEDLEPVALEWLEKNQSDLLDQIND